ncbi:MAG: four helix bundle protein [Ignavibacteriae bacterium]|nr:four helix bundle protein [Ignavibacteriota bacterium]
MHNFKELIVWQKARFLVKDIYNLVSNFPIDEKFGLTSQIKRAVISISSNIAEGAGRDSDKDFIRFLDMANGSAFELETQLYLAFDLNFINKTDLENILGQVIEIEKLIYGFRNKLKQC